MKENEMKVKELLECLFDEEQVCIGTESGSGWIWIGTVKEMKSRLSKMDKHFQKLYADNIERADADMHDLMLMLKSKDTDTIKRIRVYERIKCDAYNNWKLQSYLCKWVNFEDRPAKLDYNDENGWLIVVPGIEAGTLWWKGEKKTPFDV